MEKFKYLTGAQRNVLKHVKQDASVFLIKDLSNTQARHGSCFEMEECFRNKIPVVEISEMGDSMSCLSPSGSTFTYLKSDLRRIGFNGVAVAIENFFTFNEKSSDSLKNKIDNLNKIYEEGVKTDLSGDFSSPKKLTNTSVSFLSKGVMRKEKFAEHQFISALEVCFPMNQDVDNEDVVVCIPTFYTEVSGYDYDFVMNWVALVEKTFNFKISFLGVKSVEKIPLSDDPNNFLMKNDAYLFHLSGDEHYIKRYLVFNMLRYLYHNGYNNIPGLTLQIMQGLNSEDFFKCLLLAHYSALYNPVAGIGCLTKGKEVLYPSIDQDITEYIKNCIKLKTITNSIKRVSCPSDKVEVLKSLFKEKAYSRIIMQIRPLPPYATPVKKEKQPPKRGEGYYKKSTFGIDSDIFKSSGSANIFLGAKEVPHKEPLVMLKTGEQVPYSEWVNMGRPSTKPFLGGIKVVNPIPKLNKIY